MTLQFGHQKFQLNLNSNLARGGHGPPDVPDQCDQIGRFFKVIANKFSCNKLPK